MKKKKPPLKKLPAAPQSEEMKRALAAADTVIEGFKERVRLSKLRLKRLRKALKAAKRAAKRLRKHAAAPPAAPRAVVRKKPAPRAAPPRRAKASSRAKQSAAPVAEIKPTE